MRMLLVIAEQAPTRISRIRPWRTYTGRRLARLIGIEVEQAETISYWRNVRMTRREAREEIGRRGDQILEDLGDATRYGDVRLVVVLGRTASNAVGMAGEDELRHTWKHGKRILMIPHPSGRNRWWNDRRKAARAKEMLRRAINREQR